MWVFSTVFSYKIVVTPHLIWLAWGSDLIAKQENIVRRGNSRKMREKSTSISTRDVRRVSGWEREWLIRKGMSHLCQKNHRHYGNDCSVSNTLNHTLSCSCHPFLLHNACLCCPLLSYQWTLSLLLANISRAFFSRLNTGFWTRMIQLALRGHSLQRRRTRAKTAYHLFCQVTAKPSSKFQECGSSKLHCWINFDYSLEISSKSSLCYCGFINHSKNIKTSLTVHHILTNLFFLPPQDVM